MAGTVGILAPVVMQKVEEVGDRASWFIFDLLSKVEFLCKVVSMNCLLVSTGCPCSENNITNVIYGVTAHDLATDHARKRPQGCLITPHTNSIFTLSPRQCNHG
jgi:hypothetical protein